MDAFHEHIGKYAELIVNVGVDVQPGQVVLIRSPIFSSELVHGITASAYARGARRVYVDWQDDEFERLVLLHSPLSEIERVPQHKVNFFEQLAEEGAAIITIYSPDPLLFNDVSGEKLGTVQRVLGEAYKKFASYMHEYKIPWCLVSVPNSNWAKSVFPELTARDAMEKLWELIFTATRVNQEDPVQAWVHHVDSLRKRLATLNGLNLNALHYIAPGTDLEVQLPKGHIWKGGQRQAQTGQSFVPNIPAEEVFTVPKKYGVDGLVRTTKPLNFGGRLIHEFTVVFKNGRAEGITGRTEEETKALEAILNSNDTARYLGEVAIVPDNSPISELGIVFQNTLFDENAACHLAFGNAYPVCIHGGPDMTEAELEAHEVNVSTLHMDFMIGSGQLSVTGKCEDGTIVEILREGKWLL